MMPYKDQEKRKQANLRSQHKRRGVTPDVLSHPDVTPSGWETILAKVKQHDQGMTVSFTPGELKTILQWGIDTERIRARDDVVTEYNLTQPEPRYGPAQLTKYELLTLLNNDIKAKKIDAPLYFLGAGEPSNHSGVKYSYSKDWYR